MLGRSPGERNGNPLQYFCLGNPINRGAWWATVHGVTKESDMTEHTHAHTHVHTHTHTHTKILKSYTLDRKRNFANGIRLSILKWRDYPRLSSCPILS